MPRHAPGPWYRRGRSMWYATLPDGRQVPLGVADPDDRAAAEAAHRKLLDELTAAVSARLAVAPPPDTGKRDNPSDGRTVAQAVADFLAHWGRKAAAGRLEADTLKVYRAALGPLAAELGDRPLGSLTADDLLDWAGRPRAVPRRPAAPARPWSSSTQNGYLGAVQTLLRWCGVAMSLARPPKESRGADVVLTAEQFALVLADLNRFPARKGDLAELLKVLRASGARPGEVSPLTVEGVDWANSCRLLRRHKTKKKTGLNRPLHFNSEAMAVLLAQKERYGTGLLFRNRHGRGYTARAISVRLAGVSQRLGFRVIAYGAGRHTFATDALAAGIPDAIVAELLGHRGTTMLHFHYQHLGQRADVLKDAAEKVSRSRAG